MKQLFLFIISVLLIYSCDNRVPKIVYEENKDSKSITESSSSNTESLEKFNIGQPFTFEKLQYLYFPIGEAKENNLEIVKLSRGRNYYAGYQSSRYELCDLRNLMIRPKGIQDFKLLTQEKIKITSIKYLSKIDSIHNISVFIYKVIENDSNNDNELNKNDLIGLFKSSTDGNNFVRLSPENEQLINYKTIDSEGLLYFKTIIDVDKNGIFDEEDRYSLYEINLLTNEIKLVFNDKIYKELTLPKGS